MNDRPIRSLHINTERTWRGGEKQTLLLLRGLKRLEQPVELICQPGSPMEERAREAGVIVHPIAMRGEADLLAVRKIRRVMKHGAFDVCQMHTSHAHTLGVLARGLRKRPKTIVARRVDFSIYRRGMLKLNYLKYRFGVDRYFAISAAIREVMVEDGIPADRITVVHSGVEALPEPHATRAEIRARHGIPIDAVVIGNLAHLASHKGQPVLIDAFTRLAAERPALHLLIVGDGDERPKLEAARDASEVGDRIHFAGFQRDVAGYLGAFDVFTMPSLKEGLCTSILDALRARLPVVASRTGGIPEIVHPEETGLLAKPGDAASLAEQLTRVLDDPAWGATLAEAGEQLVREEFSIDQTVRSSLAAYRELIAGATPSRES